MPLCSGHPQGFDWRTAKSRVWSGQELCGGGALRKRPGLSRVNAQNPGHDGGAGLQPGVRSILRHSNHRRAMLRRCSQFDKPEGPSPRCIGTHRWCSRDPLPFTGLRTGRRQNRCGGAILGEKAMRPLAEWLGDRPKGGGGGCPSHQRMVLPLRLLRSQGAGCLRSPHGEPVEP